MSPWAKFFVTLFFGMFGIHKFAEREIGPGLAYLFTAGLFGVGWLYDTVCSLAAALQSSGHSSAPAAPLCGKKRLHRHPQRLGDPRRQLHGYPPLSQLVPAHGRRRQTYLLPQLLQLHPFLPSKLTDPRSNAHIPLTPSQFVLAPSLAAVV